MEVIGYFVYCNKCRRKIFIEDILIGVNHSAGKEVNCWECLDNEEKEKIIKKYELKVKEIK